MKEKINEIIKANPELLVEFNQNHKDVLIELKLRFQNMIASGDLIGRYLLCRALQETIIMQEQVSKEYVKKQMQDQESLNLVDVPKTEH